MGHCQSSSFHPAMAIFCSSSFIHPMSSPSPQRHKDGIQSAWKCNPIKKAPTIISVSFFPARFLSFERMSRQIAPSDPSAPVIAFSSVGVALINQMSPNFVRFPSEEHIEKEREAWRLKKVGGVAKSRRDVIEMQLANVRKKLERLTDKDQGNTSTQIEKELDLSNVSLLMETLLRVAVQLGHQDQEVRPSLPVNDDIENPPESHRNESNASEIQGEKSNSPSEVIDPKSRDLINLPSPPHIEAPADSETEPQDAANDTDLKVRRRPERTRSIKYLQLVPIKCCPKSPLENAHSARAVRRRLTSAREEATKSKMVQFLICKHCRQSQFEDSRALREHAKISHGKCSRDDVILLEKQKVPVKLATLKILAGRKRKRQEEKSGGDSRKKKKE